MSESERAKPPMFGGQALVEGVMMRGARAWAVALRHPDGSIVAESSGFKPAAGWRTRPVLRGLVLLVSMMRLGYQQMSMSVQINVVGGRHAMPRAVGIISAVAGIGFGMFLFVGLPWFATGRDIEAVSWLQRLSEGGLKFIIFVGYIFLLTRMARFRRIFSYHGAEHMTIHALEAGEALTVENVARHNPAHPRCGTAFIIILFFLDMIVMAILPRFGFAPDILIRVFGLTLLAGVAYELLRWGARHAWLGRLINGAGLLTQRLTTRYPDTDQIEVAIASLAHALEAEGLPLPEGSVVPLTRPIPTLEETEIARALAEADPSPEAPLD